MCVVCLLFGRMSKSVSSLKICWSGKQEPAEANISAPTQHLVVMLAMKGSPVKLHSPKCSLSSLISHMTVT